jgi:hypothetical protein
MIILALSGIVYNVFATTPSTNINFDSVGSDNQSPIPQSIFEVDPIPFLDPYLAELPPKTLPLPEQDYFLFDHHGGWWYDAEKTSDNNDDDYLCWAATATNIMEYTGWGVVSSFIDTDDMFKHIQDHWKDISGSMHNAWEWWFDSSTHTTDPSSTNRVDVVGGGNYWLSEDLYDYLHWEANTTKVLNAIDTYMQQGYPSALVIVPPSGPGAHIITCWGLRKNSLGGYVGLWVTDSDDNKGTPASPPPGPINTLRYYDLAYDSNNESWKMTNYNSGWYIIGMEVLETMPDTLGGYRPIANGGGPYAALKGTNVLFTGSAIDVYDQNNIQYRWDFDADGFWDTTFSSSPTATYTYPGEYSGTALLEVFDGIFKDVDEFEVTISTLSSAFYTLSYEQNPKFILPSIYQINFTRLFYYLPTFDAQEYEWNFGDGTNQIGSLTGDITTIHIFTSPGDYTVTLKIKDGETTVETYSTVIHVVTIEEAMQEINSYIQELEENSFKSNSDKRKNAINNMFSALNKKIAKEAYKGAINSIKRNIRQKADGLIDGKVDNDWITNQEIQQKICIMIDDTVDYLETLL